MRPAIAAGVTALILIAASGCASDEPRSGARDSTKTPTMEHIHGLGVDPKDGDLYAATHYGLFRIENGEAVRVANRVQDFMGFTIAGPNRFLASGHPGEGQGGPGSVGLIESTDAGNTWQERSLSGRADFHALEYRHGRVYGFNSMSGQLLTSKDLRSWQELTRLPIADFTVSPNDPDIMLATTENGLARSTNGGRNFEQVPSAPSMVFLNWSDDGSLAGVTPDGTVYVASGDTSARWSKRGRLNGPPEALTVHNAKSIYAAANGTVLVSNDGGSSFRPALAD